MAAAARMHAVEHGVDLRGVAVLAFGGAGPVHACGVAELLDSDRVVFPVNASVLSAFGTLVSPVRIDLARSMPRRLDAVDPAERDAMLDELRDRGPARPRRRRSVAGRRAVPLRHRRPLRRPGQRGDGVGRRGRRRGRPTTTPCTAAFEAEYRQIFGMTIPDVAVEVVTWRLSVTAESGHVEPALGATGSGAEPFTRRPVVFERNAGAGRHAGVPPRTSSAPGRRSTGRRSSRNARRQR